MKKEEDSSLELLLDTMCNTFGGVMFIAISLVVIISMTNASRNSETQQDRTADELLAQIQSLKIQLTEASQQQKTLEQLNSAISNDPRLKELSDLAMLEETAKQMRLKVSLEQQALAAVTMKLTSAEKSLTDSQKKNNTLDNEINEAEKYAAELENAITALQNEKAFSGMKMTFTTLEGKDEMPYYIFLHQDKAWRVGPDDPTDLDTPNQDVDFSVTTTPNGTLVTCAPKEAAGVPVLSGENIAHQMTKILTAIPKTRVPCFVVAKSSAETFYKLRELLKQNQRFHGFTLNTSDEDFTYSTGDEDVKYEY